MKIKKTRKDPLYNKLYRMHRSMINRCYSKGCSGYKNYGEKGIYVCDRWHDLDNFLEDIDSLENFSVDDILNSNIQLDKDIICEYKNIEPKYYSPETCKFVTRKENCSYRTTNKEFVAIHVDSGNIKFSRNIDSFCKENDLDVRHVWSCLNNKNVKVTKGWQMFFKDDYDPEKIILPAIFEFINLETNNIEEFRVIAEMARKLNISTTPISDCLNKNPDRVVMGKYKFRVKREGSRKFYNNN